MIRLGQATVLARSCRERWRGFTQSEAPWFGETRIFIRPGESSSPDSPMTGRFLAGTISLLFVVPRSMAAPVLHLPLPPIGFRDLKWFLVLIEEQHFGRAAEQLGITQSALAQVVRRMEAELDVPLVRRQSSVAIPTTAGESFAAQIAPLLGGLELATAEARRAAGVGVPVRIGCVPDLRLARLQGFIGALYTRHPELQPDVLYLRTAEQIRRLRTGRLDLGLIHDAGELEGIDVEPAFRGEPLAAFLPVSHRLATADTVAAGDLLEGDSVLVVPPRDADPALADLVVARLSDAGHDVRDVREATADDPRSLLLAIAQHHWIAIEPASTLDAVGDLASLVTVRPLAPAVAMPDTAVASRADPPPELQVIASLAREAARWLYAD